MNWFWKVSASFRPIYQLMQELKLFKVQKLELWSILWIVEACRRQLTRIQLLSNSLLQELSLWTLYMAQKSCVIQIASYEPSLTLIGLGEGNKKRGKSLNVSKYETAISFEIFSEH